MRLARVVLLGVVAVPLEAQQRELSAKEQVAHVLSRLTFGSRPGDAERVAEMGVDAWIARQLRPRTIRDDVVFAALQSNRAWSGTLDSLAVLPSVLTRSVRAMSITSSDSGSTIRMRGPDGTEMVRMIRANVLNPNLEFAAGKIVRAETSERQLFEVIADFWENHFTVYSGKASSREALIAHHRDAVRPHALGRFRDLLGAAAHSPAMLFYLDNQLSTAAGLNENYARELLELHTLGVDGGYTQDDVVAVARAFTGWGMNPIRPDPRQVQRTTFTFRDIFHDSSAKVVLGHTLAPGRGIEDGEQVLDIVARHPSTARHIAYKLSRRLVSDDPPESVVARAAETFRRTDGDIAAVVETIVTSDEFFSRAAFRAKVKTPFEFVVSARRAFGIDPDLTTATAQLVGRLGQPIFGRAEPDGWPDYAKAWMNAGAIQYRVLLAADIAASNPPFKDVIYWKGWSRYGRRDAAAQAEGVIEAFLGGFANDATRQAIASAPGENEERLATMVAIALGSPEFQRR